MLTAKNVYEQLKNEMKNIEKNRKREGEKDITEKVEHEVESRERMEMKGSERGRRNAELSNITICRRLCTAIASGCFNSAARVSANSDSIFYSLPFSEEGSASLTSEFEKNKRGNQDGDDISNKYCYDSNEKMTLHAHPSSVITYGSSAACVTSGCWSRQPQYVLYQVCTCLSIFCYLIYSLQV